MRSGRSDVSWFLRAVRVVPVIAGAALLGGMIGGFAMFAIDSALTWEPNAQMVDARTENGASAVNPQTGQATTAQTTKPVRIVGGAIPDPSAGMSLPAQQQRSAAANAQSSAALVAPALLAPNPLGPAAHLQPQAAATMPRSASVQTQAATPNVTVPQQQTRWPDALSRAHQNAAHENTAYENAHENANTQQSTVPSPAATSATTQTNEPAANKNSETDRKPINDQAAIGANDQDYSSYSRHSRHSWRHAWRYDDEAAGGAPLRRQARGYDRLYNSYGNRRDRSYGDARQQSYGDRDDQGDAASRPDLSPTDPRQYGSDARSRGRSRVIGREPPDDTGRNQAFEAPGSRAESFWGGGFRRGYQDDGY